MLGNQATQVSLIRPVPDVPLVVLVVEEDRAGDLGGGRHPKRVLLVRVRAARLLSVVLVQREYILLVVAGRLQVRLGVVSFRYLDGVLASDMDLSISLGLRITMYTK